MIFAGALILFELSKKYFQEKSFEWISKKARLWIKVYSLEVFKFLENGSVNFDEKFFQANIRSYHLLMKCLNKNC